MSNRERRLAETLEALAGPVARLECSLRDDADAILGPEAAKTRFDLLATDAFLQRFQQVTDLTLRKLFPRLLAVLEGSDLRHPLGAMLDRLDGYEILDDVPTWIQLNEQRNRLIHEYAMTPEQRHDELADALVSAERLIAAVHMISIHPTIVRGSSDD